MSKTIEEIEKEADEYALQLWPYPDGDYQRRLIKLGYMRAYNVMQSDTPLVSLSKRD